MPIIEIGNTYPTYHETIMAFCEEVMDHTTPFIIIHDYDTPKRIPIATRMSDAYRVYHTLCESKWLGVVIYVGQDTDNHFIAEWFHRVMNTRYEAHYVDTIEEARELANKIIAPHQ